MTLLRTWIAGAVGRQIVAVTVGVLALFLLVSGWYNVSRQEAALLHEIELRGRQLARTAAILAVEPLLELDYPALQTSVESLTERDTSAVYARIERSDGRVVAADSVPAAVDGRWIREYRAPIRAPSIGREPGAVIGQVVVRTSTREAARVVAESRTALVYQGIASFILLALTLAVILRLLVTKPLRKLSAQARRLGGGELDSEIRLPTHDEFGELAQTLETMRSELVTSYREIEQQNTRLREVDHLKSTFLATMSHEIRTPMNGVLGFAELLQETDLTHEQRELITTVVKSGKALLQILNDILDLSRIEAGRIPIDAIDFRLADTVAEVGNLLSAEAQRRGLEFLTEVDPRIPASLVGDPLRVRQVMTNLVGNAIKFTRSGSVTLRASLGASSPESVTVRVAVEDTGIGIGEQSQARMFEAFTQLDDSPTRSFEGTGLGLAISKSLVELMGGEIGVESELGVGSTFWFTVPLARSESGAGTPAAAAAAPRVLLADPDPDGLRSTRLLLDSWNIPCVTATTAAEATLVLAGARQAGSPIDGAVIDAAILASAGKTLTGLGGDSAQRPWFVLTVPAGAPIGRADQQEACAVLHKPFRASRLFTAILSAAPQLQRVRETRPEGTAERPARADADAGQAAATGLTESDAPRVLLVEDTLINQRLLQLALAKLGYRMDIASNGAEGLEAVRRAAEPYDAIIMDCQMPVMDGYAATREIRKLGGDAGATPIIAMTAHAMKGEREKCLDAGMDDYLTKPANLEQMRQVLASWTRLRGQPSGACGD